MMLLFLASVLLSCLPFGLSYPNGAPTSACKDMYPVGHKKDSQMTEAPFRIVVNQNSYNRWENVMVVVEATPGSLGFKGFFLQARKTNCFEVAVGQFIVNRNQTSIKSMPCLGGTMNNSVTHNTAYVKQSASVVWANRDGGDVFFQATIVKDKDTFWTGVQSQILKETSMPQNVPRQYPNCPPRKKMDVYHTAAAMHTKFSVVVIFVMLLFTKCM